MVDGAALEKRCGASHREFESPPLRHPPRTRGSCYSQPLNEEARHIRRAFCMHWGRSWCRRHTLLLTWNCRRKKCASTSACVSSFGARRACINGRRWRARRITSARCREAISSAEYGSGFEYMAGLRVLVRALRSPLPGLRLFHQLATRLSPGVRSPASPTLGGDLPRPPGAAPTSSPPVVNSAHTFESWTP